ncbi:MAG: hypothetical protein ACQETH_08990 [Candidatus Rifleibacteriota bacterium]
MDTNFHWGLIARILIIVIALAGFNLIFFVETNIFVVKKIDWQKQYADHKKAFFRQETDADKAKSNEEKIEEYKKETINQRTLEISTTVEDFLENKNIVNGVYFFKPEGEFLTKLKNSFNKPVDFFYVRGANDNYASIKRLRPKEVFKIAPAKIGYPYRNIGLLLILVAIIAGVFYRPLSKRNVTVRFADAYHSYFPDVIALIALFLLTLLFSGISTEIGMKPFSYEWKILYGIYLAMSLLISVIPMTTGYYRNFFIKVENNELLIRYYGMQQRILINQIDSIKSCLYTQPFWKKVIFFFARILAATRPERKLVEGNDEEGFALVLQNGKELVFSRKNLVGVNELERILSEKGVKTEDFSDINEEKTEA